MERVLLDETVETLYGQMDLVWSDEGGFDGDWDRSFAGQVNGLVGAANADGVYINLARPSGGSRVRIVLLDAAPPLPPQSFEDVVEVSTTIPAGVEIRCIAWDSTVAPLDDIAPGTYRVRVSAHGRDAGRQGDTGEGLLDELYLIELWLSPFAPDQILRVGSESAKYWHREIGGRRA